MTRLRIFIVLAVAIGLGGTFALATYRYIQNVPVREVSLPTTPVVVAAANLPLGTELRRDDLKVIAWPSDALPEGAFKDPEKVVGRVAIIPIGLRDPVTSTKLAPEGTAGGLSAVIPEGYRAMTVKVNDVVGLSGFVMPGSFVDVVCVITPADQQSNGNPISKIILQNIKVLASGTEIDRPKDEREANSVKAVTLQVTPEQAEKLALAVNEGKLQLVMRNYGDQDDAQTRGVNKGTLLNGDSYVPPPAPKAEAPKAPAPAQPVVRREPVRYVAPREEKPAPPPAPAAPRDSVEVIEGTKRKNVEFP